MFKLKGRTARAMSMRARLVLFALLCAVPVILLNVYQLNAEAHHIRAHAVEASTAAADTLVRRMGQYMGQVEAVTHAIGALDLTQPATREACSKALARSLAAAGPPATNFVVAASTGEILCSARPTALGSVADRSYLGEAVRLKRPFVNGYGVGRISGEGVLRVAVPTMNSAGEVRTVAAGGLRAAVLATSLTVDQHLPIAVALLDRNGVLVSRNPNDGVVELGRSFADSELFRKREAASRQTMELHGLDGVLRHYVTRPVVFHGETVLWVASGADVGALEAAALARRWRDLAIVLSLASAVVLVAAMATRPLVLARYGSLLKVAHQISSGQQGLRVPVTVKDDISPVEVAFNEMLDVMEAERAELQVSESRYRLLFENSMDGVLQTTRNGTILAANPAACALLGRSLEELLAMDPTQVLDMADPRLEVMIMLRREHGRAHGELTFVRGDGSHFQAEVATSVYQDNEGRYLTCLVMRDVTERQVAKAQIEQLNVDLEGRVALRTRELEQANRELEAFSYTVSHDLRAPVATVSAFSRLLEERNAVSGEKERHYLHRIRVAGERMNDMIEGLLVLARINRANLDWSLLDLSALAHDAARDCAEAQLDHPVELVVAEGMVARGDARLIRSLLANLLGNAWKFTRGKEGACVTVEPAADDADGQPVFCVRDNGAGFDGTYAQRLFEPFQRIHKEDEFPGVGIGLATVKHIVERHGGQVWAEGKPGEGTVVYFSLGPQLQIV